MLSIKVQPNPTQNQNSDGEEEVKPFFFNHSMVFKKIANNLITKEEKVKEFVSLSALSGGERTVVLVRTFLSS